MGAGGKVAKGTFVRVAEADAERVTLDGGQQFAHPELLTALPRHHLRELPGLTLRGRVWLLDAGTQHFNLRHLYVGASRATSSDLLSVLEDGFEQVQGWPTHGQINCGPGPQMAKSIVGMAHKWLDVLGLTGLTNQCVPYPAAKY